MMTPELETAFRQRADFVDEEILSNKDELKAYLRMPLNLRSRYYTEKEGLTDAKRTVTFADYLISANTVMRADKHFRGDSFNSEEGWFLLTDALYRLNLDGADGSSHLRDYDSADNSIRRWISCLMSYDYLGGSQPYTFVGAACFPLFNETFVFERWGNHRSLSFNGMPYVLPEPEPDFQLQIGINEEEHAERLRKLIGYPDVHMACQANWLMLKGHCVAGVNKYGDSWEANLAMFLPLMYKDAVILQLNGDSWYPREGGAKAPWGIWYRRSYIQDGRKFVREAQEKYADRV